jgi:hydrogenase-1 operon protein HyaE
MLEKRLLQRVNPENLQDFLAGEELVVLFFAGGNSQRADAHDVAVALREILKDYHGRVRAGLIDEQDEAELQPQFRVMVSPSLALVHGGTTLEVIPRVRDWRDYTRAFQRYLGSPRQPAAMETH